MFSLLTSGAPCLAKQSETVGNTEVHLWEEAEIVSVSDENAEVQFSVGRDHPVCDSLPLDQVLPLPPLEPDDTLDQVVLLEDQSSPAKEQQSDKTGNPECKSGAAAWEEHTTGIGSKLLLKMGWQGPGRGVGKTEQGRSDPIPVEVMPKGMSLDTFFQMKNEKGMVTLGKGAISMLKGKKTTAILNKEKRQEKLNQGSNKPCQDQDFFSFLNKAVASDESPGPSNPKQMKMDNKPSPNEGQSKKELGVKVFFYILYENFTSS